MPLHEAHHLIPKLKLIALTSSALLLITIVFDLVLPVRLLAYFIFIFIITATYSLVYNDHLQREISNHEDQMQLDIEKQRFLIAMELHDTVAQLIFSMSLLADAMLLSKNNSTSTQSQLQKLRQLTAITYTAMRHTLLDLQPRRIDEIPLDVLIAELVKVKQVNTDIPIEFSATGSGCYPHIQHALYRIVDQALSNAVFHAQASQISIRLLLNPDEVIIAIEDDGTGFEPTEIQPGHFGLENMREHAHSIRAILNFRTQPGPHTKRITCIWRRDKWQQSES